MHQIIHGERLTHKLPALKPGQTVAVYHKIKEGEKERIQMFQGLIIAIGSGMGAHKTFTVRKEVDGIGVEKVFPIHSPVIDKIVIKKEAQVHRAKLYYMRGRTGKASRLKETIVPQERTTNNAEKKEEVEVAETAA